MRLGMEVKYKALKSCMRLNRSTVKRIFVPQGWGESNTACFHSHMKLPTEFSEQSLHILSV